MYKTACPPQSWQVFFSLAFCKAEADVNVLKVGETRFWVSRSVSVQEWPSSSQCRHHRINNSATTALLRQFITSAMGCSRTVQTLSLNFPPANDVMLVYASALTLSGLNFAALMEFYWYLDLQQQFQFFCTDGVTSNWTNSFSLSALTEFELH